MLVGGLVFVLGACGAGSNRVGLAATSGGTPRSAETTAPAVVVDAATSATTTIARPGTSTSTAPARSLVPTSTTAAPVVATTAPTTTTTAPVVTTTTVTPPPHPAEWRLRNPEQATRASSRLDVRVSDHACAGAEYTDARTGPPTIEYRRDAVVITFVVRTDPGPALLCLTNSWFERTVELTEPLGDRALLDGVGNPPLERAKAPAA